MKLQMMIPSDIAWSEPSLSVPWNVLSLSLTASLARTKRIEARTAQTL